MGTGHWIVLVVHLSVWSQLGVLTRIFLAKLWIVTCDANHGFCFLGRNAACVADMPAARDWCRSTDPIPRPAPFLQVALTFAICLLICLAALL
jgi:hypothetical protein